MNMQIFVRYIKINANISFVNIKYTNHRRIIYVFERIENLCKKNNTTITALCIEITGSSGNLSTWKKDHIRPIWLISICKKFNVSADFILDLEGTPTSQTNANEQNHSLCQ